MKFYLWENLITDLISLNLSIKLFRILIFSCIPFSLSCIYLEKCSFHLIFKFISTKMLIITSYYLVNICRICRDVPLFLTEIDGLCILFLFLWIIFVRKLLILLYFQRNSFCICGLIIWCLSSILFSTLVFVTSFPLFSCGFNFYSLFLKTFSLKWILIHFSFLTHVFKSSFSCIQVLIGTLLCCWMCVCVHGCMCRVSNPFTFTLILTGLTICSLFITLVIFFFLSHFLSFID